MCSAGYIGPGGRVGGYAAKCHRNQIADGTDCSLGHPACHRCVVRRIYGDVDHEEIELPPLFVDVLIVPEALFNQEHAVCASRAN